MLQFFVPQVNNRFCILPVVNKPLSRPLDARQRAAKTLYLFVEC